MAQYSFPWTSVGGDRPITSAQAAAMNAAFAPDGVLVGFAASTASPTLTVTKGAAIIKGVYFDVGANPVALSLSSIVGTTAKLVARYDLAARSITLKVIEGALVQSGGTWDLLLATLTYAGGSWGQPVWNYVMSQAAMRIASGRNVCPQVAAGAYSIADVAFPVGTFTTPPIVVVGWGGWTDGTGSYSTERPIAVEPGSITKDGLKAVYLNEVAGGLAKTFTWIASGF